MTPHSTLLRRFAAATVLGTALGSAAQDAPKSYEYAYKTPQEAQAALDRSCSEASMATRTGQERCLQETAYQSHEYAETFYAGLYRAAGVPADAKFHQQMWAAWDKRALTDPKTGLRDSTVIRNYPIACQDHIVTAIADPGQIFKVSPSYKTGYNIPEYCVKTALRFSGDYQLPIDRVEGARLQRHFERIAAYYKANPVIPEQKDIPQPPAYIRPPVQDRSDWRNQASLKPGHIPV